MSYQIERERIDDAEIITINTSSPYSTRQIYIVIQKSSRAVSLSIYYRNNCLVFASTRNTFILQNPRTPKYIKQLYNIILDKFSLPLPKIPIPSQSPNP